jgi:SAM-dependent methyltransferase
VPGRAEAPLPSLRWPLPALLTWSAAWGLFAGLRLLGAPMASSLAAATLLGAIAALSGATRSRRLLLFAGFPVSLAASGLLVGLSPWIWLLPLALLALIYPLRSWTDAPIFPTPRGALAGLARRIPLPADALVLDAGCGLGDALRELAREYPQARLQGIEWSPLLAWVAALRCRDLAHVQRGDLWRSDWSGCVMIYLFQRPESLARAVAKARQELRPGAWLASLEFEAGELRPDAVHDCADGRRLWLYRAPFRDRADRAAKIAVDDGAMPLPRTGVT